MEEIPAVDVRRMLNVQRGQIYLCKLDENQTHNEENRIYSKTGLLGKTRPCLIVSSDGYNSIPEQKTYRIVPIKTNHTNLTTEEYIKQSQDVLIPINMFEGTKFLVVNQSRPISIGCISTYIGTITNKEIMNKVDDAILWIDTSLHLDSKMIEDIYNIFGDYSNFMRFLSDKRVKNIMSAYSVKKG